ncbi:Zn(2)-C6 fungal-type DNA-binding domain protein [Metarhizium robertsii ARSEF 23]|uniref:Zn(2)-C6 fungal-type DNA-binding domain protein n=1 Tax=Metarhizium robertsii (strain ARSEF 23 / ATCC MYA-3075) TaxID=655844 RepID=E9EKU5_METRA|nr:Zn(2)-C6 fungal-type DNA-binding domain protein [Metarhizium robertsii ARSEF 23]EFZ03880.2 Zn(2)-C6 fungal-type DNA-binding domain protein [Metarhizium robertsii ARSEF 23]
MVFEWKSEAHFHRVPKLVPGPPNVYFDYLERPDPAPKYEYDETGVVIKGELHIRDEKGNEAKLLPGDTFFIHRGSTIVFSTPRYAVAYKSASRHSH